MLAQSETCGVKIATYQEKNIIERWYASGPTLSWDEDIHFGMNGTEFDKVSTNPGLWGLGARILDIEKRGGRTAEETYRRMMQGTGSIPVYCECGEAKTGNGGIRFLVRPDDILDTTNKMVNMGENVTWRFDKQFVIITVPFVIVPDAKCPKKCGRKKEVFAIPKSIGGKKIKAMADERFEKSKKKIHLGISAFEPNVDKQHAEMEIKIRGVPQQKILLGMSSEHYGACWSKSALEVAHKNNNKIHFHLDGLGDVYDILAKKGKYSHNITARELRYIWRNWNRFQNNVIFYNGFTLGMNVVAVEKPWLYDDYDRIADSEKINRVKEKLNK